MVEAAFIFTQGGAGVADAADHAQHTRIVAPHHGPQQPARQRAAARLYTARKQDGLGRDARGRARLSFA
jgi:hypothetical protein